MLFTSWTFFGFFTLALAMTHASASNTLRKSVLALTGVLFYGLFFPVHVPVLLLQVAVNYALLVGLASSKEDSRRYWLFAIVGLNLCVLFAFKYVGFAQTNIVGQTVANPLLAPLGVSFYTFHMVSLAVDLRDRPAGAVPRPLDYLVYVSLWPQLIAGPLTRGHEILPQLEASPRISIASLREGTLLFLLGLFYKSTIADSIAAPIANKVFSATGPVSTADAWAGAGAFAVQIYGDFFGYTSCAIGAALCLGYRLPVNFLAPYGAAGFSDFWRRWHISLSRWISDYVYKSFGGDRRGKLRTSLNFVGTMTLAGLWHGAGWTFVFWGAAHGLLLCIERIVPLFDRWRVQARAGQRPFVWCAVTFVVVVLLWVPFRASTFEIAVKLWSAMLMPTSAVHLLPIGDIVAGIALAVIVFGLHVFNPRGEFDMLSRLSPPVQAASCVMLLALFISVPAWQQPFIYFQF